MTEPPPPPSEEPSTVEGDDRPVEVTAEPVEPPPDAGNRPTPRGSEPARSARVCPGKAKGGGPCRATPQSGSEWCPNHDPDPAHVAKMAEARRHGGRKAHGRTQREGRSPDPPADHAQLLSVLPPEPNWGALATVDDLAKGYGWTAAKLARQELDPKAANAMGTLLNGLAGVLDKAGRLRPPKAVERSIVGVIEALKAGLDPETFARVAPIVARGMVKDDLGPLLEAIAEPLDAAAREAVLSRLARLVDADPEGLGAQSSPALPGAVE